MQNPRSDNTEPTVSQEEKVEWKAGEWGGMDCGGRQAWTFQGLKGYHRSKGCSSKASEKLLNNLKQESNMN